MSSSPEPNHSEEGGGHERWLVSYADFMTLMFAFFTVLYATSEKDLSKSKEFQESIKKYLIKAGGAMGGGTPQMNQAERANSVIEQPIPTYKDGKPENIALLDQAEGFIEAGLSKEDRRKYIQDVTADEWGVRIVLPSATIYASGSDKFREDALPFLGKLASLLAETKRKILVEGHVASGESGVAKSTWDFASTRALNMLRFLEKSQKIPAAQLAAMSLADSRPAFSGEQAARNSRLEIVILNSDTEF